jgi:hypothetical protein
MITGISKEAFDHLQMEAALFGVKLEYREFPDISQLIRPGSPLAQRMPGDPERKVKYIIFQIDSDHMQGE